MRRGASAGRWARGVLATMIVMAVSASSARAVTVNGLFFGDGDYQQYLLLANDTGGGSRGKIYYYLDGNTIYLALVASKTVNDNVFGVKNGSPNDGAYMSSAGWSPVHSFQRLYGSDHAIFGIECGATGSTPDWGFTMDLLYDADGDADPAEADFIGDPFGGDGAVTALPPDFMSSTSIAWNMNNTAWDVTLGGARTSVDNYKSPDQGTTGTVLDDSYVLTDNSTLAANWNANVMWEWPLVYEFSFTWTSCTTNIFVSPGTSHNSPPKSGDQNIDFPAPPPINPTYASVADLSSFVAPSGDVVVEWQTDLEIGTVGFYLERFDPDAEAWLPVGHGLIPGLLTAQQGGTYRVKDREAAPGVPYTYRLIEVEDTAQVRLYGPFEATAEWAAPSAKAPGRRAPAGEFEATPHAARGRSQQAPGQVKKAAAGGSKASGKSSAPSGPLELRIAVQEDGMVQVSADDLAAAFGLSGKSVRGQLSAGRFRVTSGGEDVAWTAIDGGGGLLFYGQAIDSLYATENVYWITAEPGLTMDAVQGKKPKAAPGGSFEESIDFEQDVLAATTASRDPDADYWFWDGVFDDSSSRRTLSFALTAPDVLEGYELSVDLAGATVSDHPVELWLNGQRVASGSASGFERFTLTGELPVGLLVAGANTATVTGVQAPGQNIVYIDGFHLRYERPLVARGDRLLFTADGGVATVGGYTSAAIQVFDLTDPRRPAAIVATTVEGAGGFRVSFDTSRGRRYLAVAGGAIHPVTPAAMGSSRLTDLAGAVDYLLITSPELAVDAEELADYRRGVGYAARVVTTDEIYRAMSYGIVTPHAIRDFLTWSREAWGVRYVALVGMASFDYRGLQVPGESIVPSLMTGSPFGLYACDACLADSDDDGVPELAVGRLPVASGGEIAAFVDKLRAYESASALSANGTVLLLADHYDRLAGDFARDSERFADELPMAHQSRIERIYVDEQTEPTAARQQTQEWLNGGGVGWVNYLGHGGMTQMGSSSAQAFLRSGDSAALGNGPDLPVITALTCSANRFEIPGFDSVGEELVLDPDGGAIAVFAPTGLSLNGAASPLANSLGEIVFDEGVPVLGDAIVEALSRNSASNVPFMLRIYTLLGDPATRLR
jgi:Peptidase family C25